MQLHIFYSLLHIKELLNFKFITSFTTYETNPVVHAIYFIVLSVSYSKCKLYFNNDESGNSEN